MYSIRILNSGLLPGYFLNSQATEESALLFAPKYVHAFYPGKKEMEIWTEMGI